MAANLAAIIGGIIFHDPIGSGAPAIAGRVLAFCLVIAGAPLMPAPIRVTPDAASSRVAALERQRLDHLSGSGLTVGAGMLEERFGGRKGMMSTTFVVLAVSTGVVVIAVAGAVVLVVLLVTVSMRGRQKRGAQQRGEARRDVDEARERAGRAERDRDIAREGGEDLSPDR